MVQFQSEILARSWTNGRLARNVHSVAVDVVPLDDDDADVDADAELEPPIFVGIRLSRG